MAEALCFGWDVGGAHLKASLVSGGRLLDAAQWPTPLWQGLDSLDQALAQAALRWPALPQGEHAVTMSGEMADRFENREAGVTAIGALLARHLPQPRFFSLGLNPGDVGWCSAEALPQHWADVASANWQATARQVARLLPRSQGVLLDIGSTTTDLIAFGDSEVNSESRSDVQRLACSELVYQGVVRTPLCALGPRVRWRGEELNVMNEFFATTADVYRCSGELDEAHDQHPAADGGAKTVAGSLRRLARMIGLDARQASAEDWLVFAAEWRSRQLAELRGQLQRLAALHGLGPGSTLVAAGCGAFLAAELAPPHWKLLQYGRDLVERGGEATADGAAARLAAWADVCAPSVAVAWLRGEAISVHL